MVVGEARARAYAFRSYTTLNHLNQCGCDLTAEWLAANEHVRVQFLAAAPIPYVARQSAAESPKLSPRGAAPRRRANLYCGKNEIRAGLISLASVGATPTPATILYGKRSGCRSVKPEVFAKPRFIGFFGEEY
jgi:hypothetical protein